MVIVKELEINEGNVATRGVVMPQLKLEYNTVKRTDFTITLKDGERKYVAVLTLNDVQELEASLAMFRLEHAEKLLEEELKRRNKFDQYMEMLTR